MKRAGPNSSPPKGVALVITLFFLAIITIVIVGFVDSTRVERSAASSHFERVRAGEMASQGIETVIATLRRETADPTRNWTSQPGSLVVPAPKPADQKRLQTIVSLHTGAPSSKFVSERNEDIDPVLRSPNLNVRILSDQDPPTFVLDDARDLTTTKAREMKLRWIYVRKNTGAHGTNVDLGTEGLPAEEPDTRNHSNPIVGRHAYWADDESTKINYNLAWTREPTLNTNPPGHQTRIDLRALPLFEADANKPLSEQLSNKLHSFVTKDNYQTINRFFNTPFDARLFGDLKLREALDFNKFNLTHYNSDPDTTYYGKARMVLTTQLSNAAIRDAKGRLILEKGKALTRPYLDIVRRPSENSEVYWDPGVLANIDGNKLNKVILDLVNNYLKRSDWPIVDGTGHSLQEKYYRDYTGAAREQRLAQLALNIIDYVRSAESKKLIVEPIRGKYVGTQFVADFMDTSLRGKEDTFKGLTRAPSITEMGIWISDKPEAGGKNKGRFRMFGFAEVYLPENYGIDSLDLLNTDGKQWYLYFKAGAGARLRSGATAGAEYAVEHRDTRDLPETSTLSPVFIWEAVGDKSKAVMKPGDYRTLVFEVWRDTPKAQTGPLILRSAFTLGSGGSRIDVCPLGDPGSTSPVSVPKPLTYTVDVREIPAAAAYGSISSYQTSDPRVNGVAADWKLNGTNTFGRKNQAWQDVVGKPPLGVTPEQDLDSAGKVSDVSYRMPFPCLHANNRTGRVRSPGELGLIHSGIEGSSTAPTGGVPWRSLHLQPNMQGTDVVPDWAFMDLFTVPADVPQSAAVLFAPRGTSTGGRVNMNARPAPFQLDRVDPLVAVLHKCRKNTGGQTLSIDEAKVIARNIYDGKRAKETKLPAGKPYPKLTSGAPDVFESPGEVVEIEGVADQGEESEELVREIANLITARGNVFSIYTIGQAIKQTSSGKLLVTGEERQHAFVERYLVDKGNSDPADDVIGFRTIYFRNLTP